MQSFAGKYGLQKMKFLTSVGTKTFLRVILKGTYWLCQWAQLQQDEANKQHIIQVYPMLEATAIFISYFWMTL